MHIFSGVLNSQGGGDPYVPPEPANPDPYWEYVTSYLKFEGADGSTDIVDEKGLSWTAHGGAAISTTDPIEGSGSLRSPVPNSSSDYISLDPNEPVKPGADDFCAEVFFGNSGSPVIYGGYLYSVYNTDGRRCWAVRLANNSPYALYSTDGTTALSTNGNPAPGLSNREREPQMNLKNHQAIVREGSEIRCYFNGLLVNSGSVSGPLFDSDYPCLVNSAGQPSGSTTSGVADVVDEVKFTKGVSRYTGDHCYPWRAEGPQSDRASTVICLLVNDPSHSATTNTLNALIRSGFVSDNILVTLDTVASLPACDVVLICRSVDTQAKWDVVEAAWASGTPLVIGNDFGSSGSGSDSGPSTLAGLTGLVAYDSGWSGVAQATGASSLTDFFAIRPDSPIYYYTETSSYGYWVENAGDYVGVPVLKHDGVAGDRPSMTLVESGTERMNGGPTPARAVCLLDLYAGQSAYMRYIEELIARSIEWCLGHEY